jgi:hypothetical protein
MIEILLKPSHRRAKNCRQIHRSAESIRLEAELVKFLVETILDRQNVSSVDPGISIACNPGQDDFQASYCLILGI